MRHFRPGTLLVALLIAVGIGRAVPAAEPEQAQRVVYHINYDDRRKQFIALQNIQNHIDAMRNDSQLELKVVLHGDGVSMLVRPESLVNLAGFDRANATQRLTERVAGLKSQGVDFLVCNRTMQRRGIKRERDLYDVEASDVVDNGLAELARLQQAGYVYLKP